MTAFLDATPQGWRPTLDFWTAVTGTTVSPPRGDLEEFVTLLPPDGDAYLRAQRLGEGAARVHLDVHVDDPFAGDDAALALGARWVEGLGYPFMVSPGGLPLCMAPTDEARRPAPQVWHAPDGRVHTSLVDQVAIDIPQEHWDAERRFWAELTGWPEAGEPGDSEFAPLVRPPEQPLRLMPHRLDEPTGPVRAHLDLACSDRDAETARHVALGAEVDDVRALWTVMRDPEGRRYCLTDRDPATGLLG